MASRNKNDVKKLFEYWCEIREVDNRITESFPDNYNDKKISDFAFPCGLEGETTQCFSFVLTTDDSKWRYGFCRQDPKAKTAMVLITYLPWHDTFLRLLAVLAELRRPHIPTEEFRTFIKDIYKKGVPEVGASFEIFYNAGQNYFVIERPRQFQLPSIPENHNLNLYYNFVDPKNMISVFAAMLAERRIIFTSRHLDRLSSCIQAAHAFLYPMVWQHIFIPVLPMTLKDYLSAPMPYLCGVPEAVLNLVTPEELGEVVIMNCDTKIFESPFDDVHELPNEIVSQLKKQLSDSNEHIGDRVSKIFLGALVQLIGTYRDGVEFRESGKVFNRDRFIESRPSHLRPFLTKMMELQIFQQFVDERLEMLNTGLGFSDEFELETARYAEKLKKRSRNYAFLKNVREKTNPVVKSVKEGSRGVKTAYKDLKSKFREIPGTTNFRSHLNSNSQHDRIDGYQIGKSNGSVHRSAPSSPVFSKRSTGGGSIGNFQYASPKALNGAAQQLRHAPAPLAPSTSSAHIQKVASHGLVSPTVSPASSVSSSDMNLSQELQNHPLFKSPTHDGSVKPSGIREPSSHILSLQKLQRSQMPAPNNQPYLTQRSETHLFLGTAKPAIPRNKPSTLANAASPMSTKIVTTNSSYDNPPDMLSPPVPPRRDCSVYPSVMDNSYNSLNIPDSTQRSSLSNTSTLSASSSSSGASFVSALSSLSHHTLVAKTPKPFPRKREKEQAQNSSALLPTPTHNDAINDLISLEDSHNSSFDLEDFDPLNQNARPFPFFNAGTTPPTSISNPIYPFFTPPNINGRSVLDTTPPDMKPPPIPSTSPPRDDDFELLRKYGLDQFKLSEDQAASTTIRKNWTTFD